MKLQSAENIQESLQINMILRGASSKFQQESGSWHEMSKFWLIIQNHAASQTLNF